MNDSEAASTFWQTIQFMPAWEGLAVILGIIYLVLAPAINKLMHGVK